MAQRLSDQDWAIRLYIYQTFVERGAPPGTAEAAVHFGLTEQEARDAYRRLHAGHAIFLEHGTDNVRMANPLSAVPTAYRVHVMGRELYANCAWDSLGIPAMLHADARIVASDPLTGEDLRYAVVKGELCAGGWLVHFPLPFRNWYDDLIHT